MLRPRPLKAFIGLGNVGDEFAPTYHNAGFMFLDFLRTGAWKEKRGRGFAFTKHAGILLIKPIGYMNNAGRGALAALRYFKLEPAEIVLVHDESDLALGVAKLAFGGRAAGHHGVEAVIKALGTKEFWRLKIGIRPQEADSRGRFPRKSALSPRMKASEFVLKPISARDRVKLTQLFRIVSQAVETQLKLSTCWANQTSTTWRVP